jgi:hypothetical protein
VNDISACGADNLDKLPDIGRRKAEEIKAVFLKAGGAAGSLSGNKHNPQFNFVREFWRKQPLISAHSGWLFRSVSNIGIDSSMHPLLIF